MSRYLLMYVFGCVDDNLSCPFFSGNAYIGTSAIVLTQVGDFLGKFNETCYSVTAHTAGLRDRHFHR